MKWKELTLWGYTINYFFIAQLLSRQKAAISIVPLNTERLQGCSRTTLNLWESSTSSPQSPPEKLKVRTWSTAPMGSTPLPGYAQRPVTVHQTWLDCCQIHGELQRWEITYFLSKVGVLEAQKSPSKLFPPKPVTHWKRNAETIQ